MKIGNSLLRYKQEIWDAVLNYAYCNYHPSPLLEQVNIGQWVGEIFDVENMEKDLHNDIIEDLKTLELYDEIKQTCDKFVILPDVWSTAKVPITGPYYPRNQYDIDRTNIVLINGKVFDLKDVTIKSIKYNHNRLLYCFYNSDLAGGIFNTPEGRDPSFEVIWVYENAFMIDNVKGNEDKWEIPEGNEWYKFCINEDNKIVSNDSDIARVGIAINSFYIEFNYEDSVDPRVEVNIPGLASFGKDTWIRPHWYNMDDKNRVFIHNKHVLFHNSYLVIYKDNSYRIENTYSREKDVVIERIDKHTIRLEKDENIAKIVLFVRPFDPDKYPLPDSLYYKATDKNMYSSIVLKKYKKYTNELYLKMINHVGIDIDYLINWGYKYDLDVLKVIQSIFKCVTPLNPFEDVDVRFDKEYNFFKPKLIIKVKNRLQMYPLLFINHQLYMPDYRIIKEDDSDLIVLDPEQCFKLIDKKGEITYNSRVINNNYISGKINSYNPRKVTDDKFMDTEWIKNSFTSVVKDLKVVFITYNYLGGESDISRQSGRIFRNPIYKNELILDEPGYPTLEPLFKGFQFVNGNLSNERFTGDLFRRLDGVNVHGFGDLDFTVTNSQTPTNDDVYHTRVETSITNIITKSPIVVGEKGYIDLIFNDTESGNPSVSDIKVIPSSVEQGYGGIIEMSIIDPSSTLNKASIYNENNTSLLINRLLEPLVGICKVYLGNDYVSYTSQFIYADTMYPADNNGNLKEYSTLVFDKYGFECIDNVNILSSKYINEDNMYNYVSDPELYDNISIHMFPIKLKDIVREYDLEIDKDRIETYYNVGNYNDNAMNDKDVRALFLPNEPSEVRAIPVAKKSNYTLLGQKILTRYWLGTRGNPVDPTSYSKEVSPLNGKYVNTDGSLGDVPNEFSEFIAKDNLRGDINIQHIMTSEKCVYQALVDAGITYIDYNENFINSDINYEVDVNNNESVVIGSTAILHMSNDMFINKKEE